MIHRLEGTFSGSSQILRFSLKRGAFLGGLGVGMMLTGTESKQWAGRREGQCLYDGEAPVKAEG